MAHELVLRGGLQIIPTPGSGTGDPQLTLGISTKLVGEVPAVDSSTFISKTLATGNILVGSNANVATAVSVTGAISISSGGITTLQAGIVLNSNISASAGITYSKLNLTGSIVDADISASAAIVRTKLAAGTAYRLIVNNSSGIISELSALTAAKVLVSDANGQPIAANPSTTEINFVAGVTSAIQTQLGNRLSFSSAITPVTGDIIIYSGGAWTRLPIGTAGQVLNVAAGLPAWGSAVANGLPTGGTAGQYLNKIDGTNYNTQWSTLTLSKVTDVTATFTEVNKLSGVTTTTAQFNYLSTATSDIQTQLNSKLSLSLAQNAMWYGNGSNVAIQLSPGITGYVLTSVGGVPTWQPSITLTNTATNNELPKSNGTNIIPSGIFSTSSGNITTGAWQATVVAGLYGGTGVANSGMTITLGGNLTTSGAFATTLTVTGITTVTLPTSGTLMANPMTTVGDLIQGNTAGTPVNLASVATGNALISGGVATLNSWGKITSAHVDATVQTAGLSWILASGGTLTGVNTITSNAKNQLNFTGTWTATAAADSHIAFGGTLTAASGLGVTGHLFNPTLNAVGTSSVQVGLDVNPTFAGGTTPVNISARFQNGGVIIGNFSGFPIPSSSDMLLIRNDQGGTTRVGIINNTSGTTAKATINVSTSSSYAAGTFIHGISAGFATSGMYIASTGVLESTYTGGLNVGTSNASQLGFWTNNTERARFFSTGELSIGSTSVGAKVYINQVGLSSGWIPTIRIDPGAHTSLTAATEFKDYNFNTRTATWLAGTTATQRFAHFQGQTVAGASASATFTDLYTVYIDPSIVGSNAVVTNNWALGVGGNLKVQLDQNAGTYFYVLNATSGTAAYSGLLVGSSPANSTAFYSLSAGYTTSGILTSNTGVLYGGMPNGLNIGTGISTQLSFWTNNIKRQGIDANGLFTFTQSAQAVSNTFITFTQALHTGGTPVGLLYTQGAHTGLTLSVESLAINLNTSAVVQYATGAQAILRNILVQAPTIGFVGASTITDNATFTISGAPKAGTNTTQTNTHGLLIQAGAVISAGSAFGLTVNAPTGGTLNYAAQTIGGSFLFAAGTTTYAPIILPTGINLTTSKAGAMENDGTHLWFTFANSGARWQLDNQVGTFGWALAGNTLVADGIIGDVGTGGFKISLYTNNTARQVIDSKGNFSFTQDAQSASNTFINATQGNHTGGTNNRVLLISNGTRTGQSAGIGFNAYFAFGQPTQLVTGNISKLSSVQLESGGISFVGASTVTDAINLYIYGALAAASNATFTNAHSIYIESLSVGAATTNSYGLTVNAQTGGTNNYSAQFLGGIGVKFRQIPQSVTHTFIDIQQSAHTGGTPVALSISTGAHTSMTAGASYVGISLASTSTAQFASNATVATAHAIQILNGGYSFASATGIITNASLLNILGSPISIANCNITNAHGILISSATAGAGTTNSYGITVNAMTTASNNYAAQFLGGRVNFAAGTTTYAPILLNSGTNTTTAVAGAVEYDGTNLFFTPSGTTRKTAALYQVGRVTAQTAANASIATWTVGASDGSFLVSANVLVTTSTTHTFTVTCSYTDEGNTARVLTLPFYLLAGTSTTSIANAAGAVPYEGVQLHIRCKASTTITIATTGTFTTVTYNCEGSIAQIG